MIGQTVSHYKILEKLGEGGMGVVYKAHDTKLDRDVALKFLPPNLTVSEQDKARFIQEAKAAALLNHPNLCTIHAIEEHDGEIFIAMEYVDGKTLRQLIVNRQLTIDNWIGYAIQIGEGLQEGQFQKPDQGDGFWIGQAQRIAQTHQDLKHARDACVHGAGTDSRR